ncbi:MAG: hypothetical protein Q8R93_06465 [Methylicorpusculum sp.]|nr:hypothetical protein [Methylicorpusculum sp.]
MTPQNTPPPARPDWNYDAYFREQMAKKKKKDSDQSSQNNVPSTERLLNKSLNLLPT